MKFEEELTRRAEEAGKSILSYLPEEPGYQKTVFEAMKYSVAAGGKRIRPIIMEAAFELCGGDDFEAVRPFMAAMEMIHTYSLVHDDLPAMDNDDYRRGLLTTHKKFGEDMGILAGDALLNLAYETAFRAFDSDTPWQRVAEALKILGHKAGVYGMVGGQVVDVEKNGEFVDENTLMFVYQTKTAALLEGSFMIGGVLAGGSPEQMDSLEQMGRKLGIAFQIQDDILDMMGDEEKLGKPLHSDEKNGKSTYAAIHGVLASSEQVKKYTDEALACLEGFDGDKQFLADLMVWMVNRDR